MMDEKEKKTLIPDILIPLLFMCLHILAQAFGMLAVSLYLSFQKSAQGVVQPDLLKDQLGEMVADPLKVSAMSFIAALILIPIYTSYLRSHRAKLPGVLEKQQLSGQQILRVIIAAFGVIGLVNLWMLLLQGLSDKVPFFSVQLEEYDELISSLTGDNLPLFWEILVTALLVPLSEELLFRGIALAHFRRSLPVALAVLLQALLFGLFHGNFVQTSYALIPGLVFAWAYIRSRNFLVPILMHSCFNLFGGVLSSYLESAGQLVQGVFTVVIEASLFLSLIFVWQDIKARRQQLKQDI